MSTPRQIAEAFSGHRFSEAYDHLAPDVQWILVGAGAITGRDQVVATCEHTLTELEGTTTEFSRFLVIASDDAVAVDTVATYDGPDGTTTVSSCDIYEFVDGLVSVITSYTAEVETDGEPVRA